MDVNKYIGIKYKHRGRDKRGLDCWGLIKMIYADLGYKLWDIEAKYDEAMNWEGKSLFIENYWREWLEVETPRENDGVLFSARGDVADHAGVMVDEHRFIHATKAGVVVSRIMDKRWRKMLQGFYRFKEMIFAVLFFLCLTHAPASAMAFDYEAWEARQEQARIIVNGEIQRRHELEIETAKFRNAIMLERAGASNITMQNLNVASAENENFFHTKRSKK